MCTMKVDVIIIIVSVSRLWLTWYICWASDLVLYSLPFEMMGLHMENGSFEHVDLHLLDTI